MTDRELAACPFCGDEAEILGDESMTAIRCCNDQCVIWSRHPVPYNDHTHRADAIAAWNRRAPGGEDRVAVPLPPFGQIGMP